MQAGNLNRRITIQSLGTTLDAYGQNTSAWADVATVWASIKNASGLQTVKAGLDVSTVSTSIRVRYRTDITAGMRVVYGTKVWDIRAVLPDDAGHEYCDLVCRAGENQG